MFVCNLKINKKMFIKLGICMLALIMCLVFVLVGKRFYNTASRFKVQDEYDSEYLEINANNYADILKDSHENVNNYIGKKIKFVGYVYKLYDFTENQFVLARDMVISSDNQTVVVGFLCDCKSANNSYRFEHGNWVEVEGVIEKGDYHGELPVVKVTSMRKVDEPNERTVSAPSNTYIPE